MAGSHLSSYSQNVNKRTRIRVPLGSGSVGSEGDVKILKKWMSLKIGLLLGTLILFLTEAAICQDIRLFGMELPTAPMHFLYAKLDPAKFEKSTIWPDSGEQVWVTVPINDVPQFETFVGENRVISFRSDDLSIGVKHAVESASLDEGVLIVIFNGLMERAITVIPSSDGFFRILVQSNGKLDFINVKLKNFYVTVAYVNLIMSLSFSNGTSHELEEIFIRILSNLEHQVDPFESLRTKILISHFLETLTVLRKHFVPFHVRLNETLVSKDTLLIDKITDFIKRNQIYDPTYSILKANAWLFSNTLNEFLEMLERLADMIKIRQLQDRNSGLKGIERTVYAMLVQVFTERMALQFLSDQPITPLKITDDIRLEILDTRSYEFYERAVGRSLTKPAAIDFLGKRMFFRGPSLR